MLDAGLRVVSANTAFYRAFGLSPREVAGRSIYQLQEGKWASPGLRQLLEDILPMNSAFENFEVEHVSPGVGRKVLQLNARRLVQDAGEPGRILLAIEEVKP